MLLLVIMLHVRLHGWSCSKDAVLWTKFIRGLMAKPPSEQHEPTVLNVVITVFKNSVNNNCYKMC